MSCRRQLTCRQVWRNPMSGVVALLLVTIVAPLNASAQNGTASFSLNISEKELALSEPTNASIQNFLMWDLSSDRMVDRNMPYLELKNDSTNNAAITEFRMTIGDERFNFDCAVLGKCAMLAKSTSGIDLSSSVADGGNELVINIGNGGLKQGDVVRFKIALGVDADHPEIFQHPDFRTVLFDMNGRNVYDGNLLKFSTDDNSQVNVKFLLSNASTLNAGPTTFEDILVLGDEGRYYNANFRRYGVMEHVDTFTALPTSSSVIPEPTGVLLSFLSMMGGLSLLSRSPRARQAA